MQVLHTTDTESSSLPTPKARDSQAEGYEAGLRRSMPQVGTIAKAIAAGDERAFLPTPNTMDYLPARNKEDIDFSKGGHRNVRETVVNETNWGKFEPAIKRWEAVLGRHAPEPTKPDGKENAHRLSSRFTEWMMGVPEGWITDVGLSRNDELKACGNGVVPQQAELALKILLAGFDTEQRKVFELGEDVLPTPTVADTFTGSLSSTQQKEDSMHSVSLPQAIGRVNGKSV